MPNQVGYIRVSSTEQNTERQLDGISLDKTFTEKASGGSRERPQLNAMLDYRHCCKVSDEAAFCLIQRPYISKTLLTRRIS
ncbi:recombinase family protein, partial [Acinetobacter baumannii]